MFVYQFSNGKKIKKKATEKLKNFLTIFNLFKKKERREKKK